jgi:short-subunit dehydrogenase
MATENIGVPGGSFALVTGATSGFGYEIAKLLAKDGYNLVLVARSAEQLEKVAWEIGEANNVKVLPIAKDLFNGWSAQEIYNEVQENGIDVSILVNDAGQGEWGMFAEIDLQRSLDIIQLNISSLVSLTHLFLQPMIRRGEGKILQLGSEAGKTPMPLLSVYAATKAFVVSFSQALSNELKDTGVTVTVLLPGAADTDFFHKANAEDTVTYREDPLQTPEEVARDGYEAMMRGDVKVISGTKTKMHVYMANMSSDQMSAENMRKKMEPSEKTEGRISPAHQQSANERAYISNDTGERGGDLV